MNMAQQLAQSMVWDQRSGQVAQPGGRITEAGAWFWAWTYAPKVASWLGQLGIVIGLAEVATWISQTAETQNQADKVLLPASREYYTKILYDWNEAAKVRMTPGRYQFVAPIYAAGLKMAAEPDLTLAKMGSLVQAFAKHVQSEWDKYPAFTSDPVDWSTYDPAPGEGGVIVGDLGTIYMDPVAPPGAWVAPSPIPGAPRAKASILDWLILGAGIWAGWRAWRA